MHQIATRCVSDKSPSATWHTMFMWPLLLPSRQSLQTSLKTSEILLKLYSKHKQKFDVLKEILKHFYLKETSMEQLLPQIK